MTLKTKLIFKEKTLLSEILNSIYLQAVIVENELYILMMSELPLTKTSKVECNIIESDEIISFNNIENNIDKLEDSSFYDILSETENPSGNVVNYEVETSEIIEFKKLFKNIEKKTLINFVTENIENAETMMQEESLKLADAEELLEKTSKEFKNYGIDKSSTDFLSKITSDICIQNGWISPFLFVKELKDIKDVKNLKTPSHIKEVNVFQL